MQMGDSLVVQCPAPSVHDNCKEPQEHRLGQITKIPASSQEEIAYVIQDRLTFRINLDVLQFCGSRDRGNGRPVTSTVGRTKGYGVTFIVSYLVPPVRLVACPPDSFPQRKGHAIRLAVCSAAFESFRPVHEHKFSDSLA